MVIATVVVAALLAPSSSVEQVVARHIEARGGLAALHALKTLRLTGHRVFTGDGAALEAGYGALYRREHQLRLETTLQGLTAVQALDGEQAWRFLPFGGRREAEIVSRDEAAILVSEADFEGPLVDWQKKGHEVELLGSEDVDGTEAIKLRVTSKAGNVELIYLDPESFIEIRRIQKVQIRGAERVQQIDYGSYESVAGVFVPFAIATGPQGAPPTESVVIERAEANVEVEPALFRVPPKGAAVARAIVPGPGKSEVGTRAAPPLAAGAAAIDEGVLSGLGARNIGAAVMSGRIAALAARNEGGKTVLFVGAASGGVWRSRDGGTTFKPVFDKQSVQSIGALAIDPSHPKTVWAGTGESWMRNSVSIGGGIYKSTDDGDTWAPMGLPNSEHIAKILVHPKNGNIVYACVPGKLWSDSPDRGLYQTSDGGKSWTLILKGENLSTGCSSISFDPKNPDVLFAGLWDFRRRGWTFRSGGDGPEARSGSALLRSADGGRTWTRLTARSNKGLPGGPWGRIEVAVAPSDARVVYAFIESTESGLYRSADGGLTWEPRDRSQNMVWRPFYFARLIVDPTNPNRLFKPDLALIVSEDGGKSFSYAGGGMHGDCHDVWIDPSNPQRLIAGDDGGLWLSYDGGSRWWKGNNLPISQFYHVSVDGRDPYRVYGGLQDNNSWVGDSAFPGGISNARWESVYGGDGFWVFVDPTDPNAVYAEAQGGFIGRHDLRTHAQRDLQPKARLHEKLRFHWNTPIALSPTSKGTLYLGAQFLFRSRNRGESWERISPDLTSDDKEKQKQEQSGGITVDNSAAEMHTTIYSISESPKDANTIWVGTDDGNLQLTRNGGKSWSNVAGNVPELPRASWVSWVEASRHQAGTAFAAFDRHAEGDMTPWVYRTTDFGKSWTRIVSPAQGVRGYAHVIKQDPVNPALYYLGTEFGLWISLDEGKSWAQFRGGDLPAVAVRDLQVHPREHDLIIATHGRGIWIIDDLTPLRALSPKLAERSVAFLPGRPIQQRMSASSGWPEGDASYSGDNPAGGAVVTFYQRSRHLFGRFKLDILDERGTLIDTVVPPKRRGIGRVVWSMQLKPARVPKAASLAGSASYGPKVVPGTYIFRLTRGDEVIEERRKIGLDARAPYDVSQRKAQFDALVKVQHLFGEMSDLVDRLDATVGSARDRLRALPANDALASKLKSLVGKLDETKKKIVATKEGGAITGEERIREHTDQLYGAILTWEGRPTRNQVERIDVLKRELDEVAKEYGTLVAKSATPLNEELRRRQLQPLATLAAPRGDGELEGGEGDADRVDRETAETLLTCWSAHRLECPLPVEADRPARR